MKKQREQGVVLLSCLMFLLIILALLRFNLNATKMEEMKAGADYDLLSAEEISMMVLKDAERDIMRINADGISLQDSSVNLGNDPDEVVRLALDYWKNLNTDSRPGIYDGDSLTGTTPLYVDINGASEAWNNNRCGSATVCFGNQTQSKAIFYRPDGNGGISKVEVPHTNGSRVGKYIIERFMGNGTALSLGASDNNSIIFRVTAVGFSTPVGNRTLNSANSVVQATYVLAQ